MPPTVLYPMLMILPSSIALLFGISDKKATPKGRKAALWYCLVFSVAGVLLNSANSFSQSAEQHLLATLILAVCAFPMWLYLLRSEKGMPFMPFLCLVYAAYFALPVFSTADVYWRFRGFPEEAQVKALSLVLGGLVAMLVTYYALPRTIWKGLLPSKFAVGWSADRGDDKAKRAAVVLAIMGLVSYIVTRNAGVQASLGALADFVNQLSLLAITILFFLQLQGKLSRGYLLLLWLVVMPVQLLNDISTGFMYPLFRDSFLLAMIYLLFKKRIPWAAFAISLAVFVPLLMVKSDFRKATWYAGDNQSGGSFSSGQLYLNLIATKFSSYNSDDMQRGLEEVVSRLDNRAILVSVVSQTPSDVPYWEGQTYYSLLWRAIPRVLWPDKPIEDLGQGFGHRYKILDAQDLSTSMNLPLIVEMYVNFGTVGVLFGMACLGLIYHALRYTFESEGTDNWGIVTSVLIYTALLQVDSNFTLVFGNLLYTILLFYVLGRFIFGRTTSKPHSIPLRSGAKRLI